MPSLCLSARLTLCSLSDISVVLLQSLFLSFYLCFYFIYVYLSSSLSVYLLFSLSVSVSRLSASLTVSFCLCFSVPVFVYLCLSHFLSVSPTLTCLLFLYLPTCISICVSSHILAYLPALNESSFHSILSFPSRCLSLAP